MPRVPPVTTLVLHTWREHCKPKPWDRPNGSDGEDDAVGGGHSSDAGGGPPLPPRRLPVGRAAAGARGGRLPYRRSTSVDEGLVAGGGGSGSGSGGGGRARHRLAGSGSGTPRDVDAGRSGPSHRRSASRPEPPSAVLSPSSSEDDLTLGASWAVPADGPAAWDVPTAAAAICLPAASRAAMRRSVSVDMDLRSDRGGGDAAAGAPTPLHGSVGGSGDVPTWGTSPVGAVSSPATAVTAADSVTTGHSFLTDLGGSLGAQLPGGVSSSAPTVSLLAGRGSAPQLAPVPAASSQALATAGAPAWSIPSRRGVRGGGRRAFPRSASTDGSGPALAAAARNLATGGGTSRSGVRLAATASSGSSAGKLLARGPVALPVASGAGEGIDSLPPLPPGFGGGHLHHPYPYPYPPHPPYAHSARPPPPPAFFLRGIPRATAVDDLHLPNRMAASPRRKVRRSASTDEALEALPPLPPRGGTAPSRAAATCDDGDEVTDLELGSAPPAAAAPGGGSPLVPPVWGRRAARRRRDEGLCSLGNGVVRTRPPRPSGKDWREGSSAGGSISDGSDVT